MSPEQRDFYNLLGLRRDATLEDIRRAYFEAARKLHPDTNTVVLGDEEDLEKQDMKVARVNWIKYEGVEGEMDVVTKIRYKDKGSLSTILSSGSDVVVRFYEKAKGIAPGQSAVFYEGDEVIGGGIIQRS